ncbi:MAG: alpha/beta fold hydrolase [Gammaproteobacteria bacterium]
MPSIQNGGVSIYYTDEGQGPAVLLTHAYGASASMWEPQIAALKDKYRVISWDLRGHARSDSPADETQYSERYCIEDMKAILDHLGLKQVILGGLSLGGYLSLAFRLQYPECVSALMLFSCGPGYRDPHAREKWNRFAHRLADKVQDKGLAALGDGSEIRIDEHRNLDGLQKAARGILAQFDDRVIQSLTQIDLPTLVLVGSEDKNYHNSSSYMAKKIPHAQHSHIEQAGHAANLQQPQAFNAALLHFLDQQQH